MKANFVIVHRDTLKKAIVEIINHPQMCDFNVTLLSNGKFLLVIEESDDFIREQIDELIWNVIEIEE